MRLSNSINYARLQLVSLCLCAVGTAAGQTNPPGVASQDASVWINEGIDTAIKSGKSSYSIPAGSYTLENPIIVPPGTNNFTLEGAGSSKTLLVATKDLSYPGYAILVGQVVQLNNWGLTNLEPGASIANVRTGDTTVKLTTYNVAFKAGEYAVILDQNKVEQSGIGEDDAQFNRAELTKIVAVNNTAHTVTLDVPAAREYNDEPMIYPCSNLVSTGITVKGVSFNAAVSGSANPNNGIINAELTDDLALSDISVTNFSDRAIATDLVRNGLMSDLRITDGANITDPGSGYGLTFCRSRMITVSDSTANSVRHAFICTNGTTDVTFSNCSAVVMPGAIDDFNTHGFDERRIQYVGCVGTINISNPNWLGGAENITINNCQSTQGIYFGPNTSGVTVENSTVGPIFFDSHSGTTGIPSSGYADGITFTDSNIIGNWAIGKCLVQMGTASFKGCYFESTVTSWGGPVLCSANAIGNLNFSDCQFTDDSARAPFELLGAPELYLSLSGCTLTSKLGSLNAFELQTGSMNLDLVNNTFNTLKPRNKKDVVSFIDVPSNAKLTSVNNACVQH